MSPDAAQCRQLAAWLAQTDIDVLELHGPGLHLRLRRDAQATVPTQQAHAAAGAHTTVPTPAPTRAPTDLTVLAPSVGVWLRAHPLHSQPLVALGQAVQAAQTVGFLRIGTLLLPVTAACAGRVQALLAPDGRVVGYGTAVLSLAPL